jgi:uroporphyrinogen decarboxylase
MNDRENYLRTLEFKSPQWIGFGVHLCWPVWNRHREDLVELVGRYPKILGHLKRGPYRMYFNPTIPEDFDAPPPPGTRAGDTRTDDWGCIFECAYDGLGGLPNDAKAPLANWGALDTYQPPDLMNFRDREGHDWDGIKKDFEIRREKGLLRRGDGGQLFTRLYWLRGWENLMVDILTDDSHLPRLIDMLAEYENKLVEQWLAIGVDAMYFHTDIGTQDALMISPDKFRQWIKPMFERIFRPVRDAGLPVVLSSDGRLVDIVDDLIECGVSAHDPQFRANTLDGIEKHYKGKMCINLDLDRQMFPFCTPNDIREHVKVSLDRLHMPEGGLSMSCDVNDPRTPLENIEAMCEAGYEFCLVNKP